MRNTIVEDRILARVAREAVGWDDGTAASERADIAVGRAVVALRVLGVDVTSEVAQTLRDDIVLVLAEEAAPPCTGDAAAPALRVAA